MFRLILIILGVWIWLLSYAQAAQPLQVEVGSKGGGTVITVKGDYQSYRALGSYSPARLAIVFYGGSLSPGSKRKIEVSSQTVSYVELVPVSKGVSMVVYSRDPKTLFKYDLGETQEGLRLYIAKTIQGKEERFPKPISLYSGQKITMDFYKTDIHNVMRLFGEISGKNIILDEKVRGEVTISLKDVPWDQALDMILEANNLIKEEKDGIITIRTLQDTAAEKGFLVVTPMPNEKIRAYGEWTKERGLQARLYGLLYRGRMLEKEGRHAEGFRVYEEAYRLMKSDQRLLDNNPWIFETLCEMGFRLGMYEKAYYYAREAIRYRGEDPWAAHVAAISAAMMDKMAEAVVYFDMAMAQKEENPQLLLNYALFLERSGKKESALNLYKRYEEIMGPDARIGLNIGRIMEELGKKQEACEKYKEILNYRKVEDGGISTRIYERMKGVCGEGVNR